MTLTIKVSLDNEAFSEAAEIEIAAILKHVAECLANESVHVGVSLKLRDSNGNAVGYAKVTR